MANTRKAAAKKTKTTRKTTIRDESAESGLDVVRMDRRVSRDRRGAPDRRNTCEPVAVEHRATERRAKVSRRRQIDPTTCERDYSAEEIAFMNAMEQYKRTSGRMFPTCSEILEVLANLGYQKRLPEPSPDPLSSQLEDTLPQCQPAVLPDAELALDSLLVDTSLAL